MYSLGIELTNACNLRCKHCLRDFSEDETYFSIGLLKKIIREAKKFNVKEISFTGGEPLLHPRFKEIVENVVAEGYSYSLITNGIDIDPFLGLFNRTRDKIIRIGVSLDGVTEDINDYNRGKGSFKKTVSTLVKLKELKLPVMVQMCVGEFNKHQVENMVFFASRLGACEVYFAHILPAGRSNGCMRREERRNIEDTVNRLAEEIKTPVHLSVGHSVETPLYTCAALALQRINIDFKGYLTFCCQISNYRGRGSSVAAPDFVADLNNCSLSKGINLLFDKIHKFQKDRIKNLSGNFNGFYFPCDYCLKYFDKVGNT